MPISNPYRDKLTELKKTYDQLKVGKASLLKIIDEAEIPEMVYNSNAIENSTLSLKQTEKILLELEVSKDLNLREVFEAKNLARVIEYIEGKTKEDLSEEVILLLHKMLITNINDQIAGRFRKKDEYVRVGSHIAPPGQHIKKLIGKILIDYSSHLEMYFVDKIAKFHLDFENIHPFLDGNGRIGRVIINFQLATLGFPGIIIRDKEKKIYYDSFAKYRDSKNTKPMEHIITLMLLESLHKRISYLKGDKIINLSEYNKKSPQALLNAAKRQTIPAFREKGVWKIGL